MKANLDPQITQITQITFWIQMIFGVNGNRVARDDGCHWLRTLPEPKNVICVICGS
jgi:hypothetical protein